MAITLTVSIGAPAAFAARTTLRPLASSPSGSTGRVSVIFRPGFAAASRAIACERLAIDAGSATAAPSMSKSMNFRWYALTTAWYSAVRLFTSPHAWASSIPLAPPKEIFTSPPAWRIFVISSSCHPLRGSKALNQLALHPAELTNASVKFFSPLADEISLSTGVGHEPMSMYGAVNSVAPPPPPPPLDVVADTALLAPEGGGCPRHRLRRRRRIRR